MGAAGVVVVIVAAVVLAVVLTRGGSASSNAPAIGNAASGLPGATDIETLFKGIPQKGLTLGSAFAPVTMVEYIDLQCPFCQQFETQVMPNIVRKYVRPGKVKVQVRILDFIGPDSSRGRKGMIAAAEQNKAFNFAQLLYFNQRTENSGWLSDNMVEQAAASITGLKVRRLLSVQGSSAVAKQAKTFDAEATADKVTGTPTLFVGKSGTKGKQVPLQSPTDQQTLVKSIDAALAS